MSSELRFDVLVLGGGGAALRAALSACEQGAKTAILSKGEAGKSGATYYSVAEVGAFNVPDGALDPEDSPEEFYRDMEMVALGTAQLPLCRILAEQAESALQYLEKISSGTVFAKEDGHFKVYQACFSTRPRSHVVENHFKPILRALREEVARRDITVLSGLQAVDLLKEDGQVCGVYALDEAGAPVIVHAGSVVLATGGASRLFRRNMYPRDITGDGYAMAWRAGARMSNMEFIQAGIGVAAPFINLFGNYLWEANPQIENAAGEPVLEKYLPAEVTPEAVIREKTHFPFSTRDLSRYIEIAVQSEYNYGRGTAGGNMLLNFRGTDFDSLFRRDPVFASMWKVTYQWHKERGIDLYRDPVEIACFAHALNGGVLIDEHAAASLPGLYAAGETASGPHGADRLGGNMSVTCQVFGNIAGRSAAAYAKGLKAHPTGEASAREIARRLEQLTSGTRRECRDLLETLQERSDKALMIIRSQTGLQKYLTELADLKAEIARGGTAGCLGELVQLENLAEVGGLIARAALERKESRGSHYRADYPDADPALAHPIILEKA